jgi:hypothetical protein
MTFALNTKAQIGDARSTLAIGVNGGYNMNSVRFTPTVKQGQKGGLVGGFTIRYTCEKYFKTLCALQAEINYAQLGWKEITKENADYTYERTLNYVQVPLLSRFAWGREERGVQAFFLVGPQVGYCLSESEKRPTDWTGFIASRPNEKLTPAYDMKVQNKFDYGITGGLGVELNSKIGHFMVEGRYYYGLGDIYKNSKKDIFARSDHATIVIKASYLFDIINKKR